MNINTRKNLMQYGNKVCSENILAPKDRVTPVVYTGMEEQYTTIYFNDYFDYDPIYSLMTDIDSVRQIGGYSKINLYFSSLGGNADCLFTLADFLNQINDIEIDLIVSGMVASAGFYLLLMIENSNVNIIFSSGSRGIIHLGDTLLSSRGSLSKESERYNFDKFREKDIQELNKYFKENYINKLKIRKEDRRRLNQGQDLHLLKDELEIIVNDFHGKRYYESDEFLNTYFEIKSRIEQGEGILKSMEEEYKKCLGKSLDKNLTK